MSKSTEADLFRWGREKHGDPRRSSRAQRWAPRRRNGFAAALAVVVEAGKKGEVELPETLRALGPSRPPMRSRPAPQPTAAPLPIFASATVSAPPVASVALATAPAAPAPEARCGTETEPSARCPRCGFHGEVAAHFGYRKIDGKRRPQSWCRGCRRTRREAASPMVSEAKAFARETVAEADLPLWSAVSDDA